MNLLDMRTKLRKRVGNPTITDVPDADLTDAINSAYGDVAVRYKFHKVRKLCTFPTIVNDPRYGLPSDCFAVLRLRDNTNKIKLEKVGDRAAATDVTTVSGKPTKYVRQRDWVLLIPPPDAIYTMELFYKAKPSDLAADADFPITPLPWDEGILRLAKYYHFENIGDLPKAQSALNVYESWASQTPTEFDDEAEWIDSGVEIPTLAPQDPRLDFDNAP